MGGDMGGGTPPGGDMGGDMGGGFAPGGMGGAFSYDSIISVTTNSDKTVSRGSLVYGYASSPTTVSAGSGVSEIADGCFAGCETLTSVDLSASALTKVPSDCFAGCTALRSVVLPSGCKMVGANAFAGCTSLTSVTGGSLKTIEADAFRDCTSLTTAPTNAANIGVCAFANCPKLGDIDLSEKGDLSSDDEDCASGSGGCSTDSSGNFGASGGNASATMAALFDDEATVLTASYASVYDGIVLDGDETIGSVKLKVGKANKRTKTAKFSAAVNILGRKKVTYSGNATVDGTGVVTLTLAKSGATMSATVEGEAFTGEIDGFEIVGVRNVSAAKEARSAEYNDWVGTYDIVLAATNATGTGAAFAAGYSSLAVTVLKKGKARVKGVMADGTKVSVSGLAVLLSADGTKACVDVVAPLYKNKRGGFGFQLWLGADGTVDVSGVSAWDASVSTSAQFIAALEPVAANALSAPSNGTLTFAADADAIPATLNGLAVVADSLPTAISVTAAAGKLKAEKNNIAKLTISRNATTGLFTGRFYVFTQNGTKLKRTAAKFNGVMCGDYGYGSAIIKGVGAIPLRITP